MIKKILIVSGLVYAVFVCGVGFILLADFDNFAYISGAGWFAFMFAALLCVVLSAGLYALAFYSARSGRDEISDLSENSSSHHDPRIR